MVENWNRILHMQEYGLFSLIVKKDFSKKIKLLQHKIMNCCFTFSFGNNFWVVFSKTECTTKSYFVYSSEM